MQQQTEVNKTSRDGRTRGKTKRGQDTHTIAATTEATRGKTDTNHTLQETKGPNR